MPRKPTPDKATPRAPSDRSVSRPDLRILALAERCVLPESVQEPFDRWRIVRARDAVAETVRRRHPDDFMLNLFLERLEAAEDEAQIYEGIYALAEAVEVNRQQLGLHSYYMVIVMAGQLNPWGLLNVGRNFDSPPRTVLDAARELWRLANANGVDVRALLARIDDDPLLDALNAHAPIPRRRRRRYPS